MGTENIIQWNCRGLLKNVDDVYEMLHGNEPSITLLQESYLSSKQTSFLNKYMIFREHTLIGQCRRCSRMVYTAIHIVLGHIGVQ